jgi:uncharacterized protein
VPFQKIINDPVHGFITIDDDLILQIINHPYFQRLRRIKQMAMAHLVYPGAVHTRFQHSLGAYHLMCLSLNELQHKGFDISPNEAQGAKIAILLHDIGHGPYSHALERTLVNVNHEAISKLIMYQLNKIFKGALDTAINIFEGHTTKLFLHQLVSSQLDTDRMDYLARDSFFTGVSEGVIGYDRIIKMLTISNNQLAIEDKGIRSVEKFIIARKLMYDQVYFHKTVVSSEQLLVKVLERAKFIVAKGQQVFATPTLQYFLMHNFSLQDFEKDENCMQNFINLDDDDVMSAIKIWTTHSDAILSDLSKRILNRNLFKIKFSYTNDFDEIENAISAKYSLNESTKGYYLIKDNFEVAIYNATSEKIIIAFKDGTSMELSDIPNTLIEHLALTPIKKYYLCYPN